MAARARARDLAAADANRLVPRLETIDLAAETRELGSLFRSAVADAGLAFHVSCEMEHAFRVDRTMWAKIVVNLLANALKFTFEGEIRLELRERAKHAELVVSDTGVGISTADRAHVFERFFRGRGQRARTHDGSGIGLALTHELVRRHGGRMRVQSEEGRGTTFTVWLPLDSPTVRAGDTVAPDASEREATVAFVAAQALAWTRPIARPDDALAPTLETDSLEGLEAFRRDSAGARILVVDDNADMRTYLERLLAEAGWTVETVADGQEALERAHASRPELVVADVMMPRMDGFELLRAIRADDDLRLTPIVLLTARAGEASALEGLVAGANDYVAKPFSARELVARLGAQIQLARGRGRVERLASHRAEPFEALDGLVDPLEIEAAACGVLGRRFSVEHVVYGELESDVALATWGRSYDGALRGGRTMAVADIDEDARFDDAERAEWHATDRRAALAVPVVEGGRAVAYIELASRRPRAWTELDLAIVGEAALRTREAIRRARAENALRESERSLRRSQAWLAAQNAAFQSAMNGAPLEVSLGILTRAAVEQLDGDCRCAFYVANADGTTLHHVVGMSEAYARAVDGFAISPESLACGLAVGVGQPVITPDVYDEPRWRPWTWLAREYGYRGCWSFPVETVAGKLVGSFAMYFAEPREPTPRVRELVVTLSKTAAIVISNGERGRVRPTRRPS